MITLASIIFIIDIIKLLKIITTPFNSVKIMILISIICILILYFFLISIIWLIIDIRRYNFTGKLLKINLRLKEESLKKNKIYIILCKLLHILKGQSVLYYHVRIFTFIVKYEFLKWYIYKYSFKVFIKKVIDEKFHKIDIFLLDIYYRWLMRHDANDIKWELKKIREREIDIKIFYIKKIKENLENQEIIIKRKEYEPLVFKDKEFKELQKIKKKLHKQLKITNSVFKIVEKNTFYLRFSNYYKKLSHIFFHYSLSLFWLLTTTKVWFTDLKLNLIQPYLKEHIKFLISQMQDQTTLQRKIVYQNDLSQDIFTINNMGHTKVPIIKPHLSYNWDINNDIDYVINYKYHFRTNNPVYFDSKWYVHRDNQVWQYFTGTNIYGNKQQGLQTWHHYISKTHWGSDININSDLIPQQPKLKSYLEGYRYIGYPERFFDYSLDMMLYFIDMLYFKVGLFPGTEYYEIDINMEIPPIIINFNLLFLILVFNIWFVFTIILISRKVQIFIKYFHFYFIVMFSFSIYLYFQTYLEHFDHNFLISSCIYIIKLPFNYLKFNINDLDYLYIIWLNMLY